MGASKFLVLRSICLDGFLVGVIELAGLISNV